MERNWGSYSLLQRGGCDGAWMVQGVFQMVVYFLGGNGWHCAMQVW